MLSSIFHVFSLKSKRFPGPLKKRLDGPLWMILNFILPLWAYRNIEVLKTTPFRTHLHSFAEPPLWIILSFQLYINNNGNEAHDCGTMRLCELYWISPCLSELRGKLRFSKQHRFGFIFSVVLFLSLLFVFAFFCFCFWLCFWFVLLVRVSISNKNNDTHPFPLSKKKYIYIHMSV